MHLGRGWPALAGDHAVFLNEGSSGATAVTILSGLGGQCFPTAGRAERPTVVDSKTETANIMTTRSENLQWCHALVPRISAAAGATH